MIMQNHIILDVWRVSLSVDLPSICGRILCYHTTYYLMIVARASWCLPIGYGKRRCIQPKLRRWRAVSMKDILKRIAWPRLYGGILQCDYLVLQCHSYFLQREWDPPDNIEERSRGVDSSKKLVIHTLHGRFQITLVSKWYCYYLHLHKLPADAMQGNNYRHQNTSSWGAQLVGACT